MITGKQARAARALLGWSQGEVSKHAGVADRTLRSIEDGYGASPTVLSKVEKTFEDHGVEFLPGNGVREKDAFVTVFSGEDGLISVWDDIFETVSLAHKKEILIANNEEPLNYSKRIEEYLTFHIQRLEDIGAQEKIITCNTGDIFLDGPIEYRTIPEEDFQNTPTIIYGDKVALWKWGPPPRAIIIHDVMIAESIRKLFGFAWKHARTRERA